MSDKRLTWEEAVNWLKAQPSQMELVRACHYDDPLIESARRYRESSEWRAVRGYLPQAGRALDLGAGRGIASYALAMDGWQVTALEPDASELVGAGAIRALARETGLPIEVEQEWGERLPFADATFDLVHARAVLHHAFDLSSLCREAARVLKPGGMFIATREHVISRPGDLPAFLTAHPLHRLYGGEHACLLDEYLAALRAAGIKVREVLNPFQSDINLYPETREALRHRIAARLGVPDGWLPYWLLGWVGSRIKTPGRLYTFIGSKP